jgi:hypothetical protein
MKESESSGASANGPYVLHLLRTTACQHGSGKHASDTTSVSFNLSLDFSWALSPRTGSGRLQSRIQMTVLCTARRRPWNLASLLHRGFVSCMALVRSWGVQNALLLSRFMTHYFQAMQRIQTDEC